MNITDKYKNTPKNNTKSNIINYTNNNGFKAKNKKEKTNNEQSKNR